ncbi:MAG: hypothetical protein HQM10_26845 [Candidatus Riflebacteria bacterium]|nr:hypothetical protein [Candidatus Riflebacteria bacterium]
MNTNDKQPVEQEAGFPNSRSFFRQIPLTISSEISRRDFFAAFALSGILANKRYDDLPPDGFAIFAFGFADAMIKKSEE